jgi:hypothetical protein
MFTKVVKTGKIDLNTLTLIDGVHVFCGSVLEILLLVAMPSEEIIRQTESDGDSRCGQFEMQHNKPIHGVVPSHRKTPYRVDKTNGIFEVPSNGLEKRNIN